MEKFKTIFLIIILLVLSVSCTKSKNAIKREELKNMSEGKSGIKEIDDFESVKIGNNIWMTKNLNVDKLNNGEKIYESKNIEDWVKKNNEKKPSFCYYKFNSKDSHKYGKIYNYYALTSDLAPKGWHVAMKSEWNELMNKYQNSTSSLMYLDNDIESNESGFSSFLCGYLVCDLGGGGTYYPNFSDQSTGWWYSSSKTDLLKAVLLDMNNFYIQEYGENNNTNQNLISSGFYIRCVRD